MAYYAVNQQADKCAKLSAGVIDYNHQGEICLLKHNGDKEDYKWNPKDSLGCLVFP